MKQRQALPLEFCLQVAELTTVLTWLAAHNYQPSVTMGKVAKRRMYRFLYEKQLKDPPQSYLLDHAARQLVAGRPVRLVRSEVGEQTTEMILLRKSNGEVIVRSNLAALGKLEPHMKVLGDQERVWRIPHGRLALLRYAAA